MIVYLRRACNADEKLIYKWRNLPCIYNLGSLKRPVTQMEHRKWFRSVIIDNSCMLFIICFNDIDCGMIRYDLIANNTWSVSIYLVGVNAKQGIGSQAIQKSFEVMPIDSRVIAFIKDNNIDSLSFFNKNGFVKSDFRKDSHVVMEKYINVSKILG